MELDDDIYLRILVYDYFPQKKNWYYINYSSLSIQAEKTLSFRIHPSGHEKKLVQ
jgi:hypothetical protein